ncbi:WD repeat-containing protein 90 [Trebouxia sp. C0009 RCD-2024]
MSIAGRQLYSQGFSQQSRRPACASPRLRTLTPRPQPRRRNAAISCSTDARLTSGAVSSQRCEKEAILLQRFKAHDAAITASLVLQDAGGTKELVTASMDKSLALWRLQDESLPESAPSSPLVSKVVRLTPKVAPIFSLVADSQALGASHNQVFCGNLAKSIVAWEPPDRELIPKVHLNSHTGWVRALATSRQWLFSCSCNVLCQWDMARAVPRKVREVKLFTGDIQSLCTSRNMVFACTSNGAIRAWNIGKKGELSEAGVREKAHKDRITTILWHKNFLYSLGYDGSVKMWDANKLELVMEVKKAHEGQRIQCAAVAPDGCLYTGGDDKLVRRWKLGSLAPADADALFCHNYNVRSLSAGRHDILVSGDSSGEVAIWKV